MKFDDLSAQAAGCSTQLNGIIISRGILIEQGFIPLNSVFGLGGSRLTASLNPFTLYPENRLALALAGFGNFLTLFFQLQIFGVVGLIMVELSMM